MKNTVFITFGDGDFRYKRSANRLCRGIQSTGVYEKIFNLDLNWLKSVDQEVYAQVSEWLSKGDIKGIGYWMWKSVALIWAAKNFPNSLIHYMDAGHVVVPGANSALTIEKWLNEAQQKDGLAWQLPDHPEVVWTKRETLEYLDPSKEFWNSSQIEGGFVILSSKSALAFGEALRKVELEDFGFLLIDQQKLQQFEHFKAHRHDQSIHSLLWKQFGFHYSATQTSLPGSCDSVIAARHASGLHAEQSASHYLQKNLEFYLGKLHKFTLMHPKIFPNFRIPIKNDFRYQ